MGQKAAELLIDMAFHGKKLKPMTMKIDGPLVIRNSTRAAVSLVDRVLNIDESRGMAKGHSANRERR
jgi:hypothetical protein